MLLIRIFVVVILFLIIGSLYKAWKALAQGEAGSEKVVKALTVRISLSIFLFVTLILLMYFGVIHH